jgi:phage terminase small subunit
VSQKKKKPLSSKAKRFCKEYLVDSNATQAAIRAGYSKKTANKTGPRLMVNVGIKNEIKRLMKPIEKRLEISAERTLKEAGRLAFFDIRKAFDKNGNLKNIQDLDDDTAAALAGIENEQLFDGKGKDREYIGDLKKIKTFDKKGAIELLMKHFGLLIERHEHTGKDGAPLFEQLISDAKDILKKHKSKKPQGKPHAV